MSYADALASLNYVVAAYFEPQLLRSVPLDKRWDFMLSEYSQGPCENVTSSNFSGVATVVLSDNVTCVASAACIIEANINQFFVFSSVLWSFAIATQVFLQVQFNRPHMFSRGGNLPYVLFCWGVPLLTCIIGTALDRYGPDQTGCWLVSDNFLFVILFFYAFFLAGMFYMVVVYILIGWKVVRVKRRATSSSTTSLKSNKWKVLRRFIGYPTVLIVAWLGSSIVDLSSSSVFPCWLLLWKASTFPAQGFLNFLCYGINERLHRKLRDCSRRKRKLSEVDTSFVFEKGDAKHSSVLWSVCGCCLTKQKVEYLEAKFEESEPRSEESERETRAFALSDLEIHP
mmetsp:Transcript_441/g.795  ORF Transcript_441/g.795 Transcript_441/m.795 type:complete len:342 (-) Transcript_441:588-1613(-)